MSGPSPHTGAPGAEDPGADEAGGDPGAAGPKPVVGPEGFAALDLRIGRVVAVDDFPEAHRPAYRLTVDFGALGHRRTSAQVTNYAPEELLGRDVVGAVNLGTRRIAGFESEFLVLGGLEPDGTVRLLQPDATMAPGSRVA